MTSVLLLGGGTQALAIVKDLAKSGYRVLIFFEETNYADKSRYVSKAIPCQVSVKSENYLTCLEEIITQEKIDVLIPMGDKTAEFLSINKNRLSKIVKFTIPNHDIFMRGYDKNKLMKVCKENGFPHPQTIDLAEIKDLNDDEIKNFPYPTMLKPNRTTGGRGMVVIDSHQELLEKYPSLHLQYGEYHLQRFIKAGGKQVKIQLCVDADGRLIAHSAMHKIRWFPIKAGSSCCSVSIVEDKMTEICHQLLKDLNWEGFADFDLIEDPDTGELLIMEINPRLPACIGASVHAGLDWWQILVDQALGNPPKECTCRPGVFLRHLGFDVLWFFKSPDRWKAKPNWFKFFGKNVNYQDMSGWSDPLPFITGTFHNIKKLMSPSFRESKTV